MNNKVILIILDGLNYQVACNCMGYLSGLLEQKKATRYRIECELPSMSRPLYECILTGVRPIESGITHNNISRLSKNESIFSLAKTQGKITAAAAYSWMSELYNRAPYNPQTDRFTDDESLNIQHGCFYQWSHYPDEALFSDAEHLRHVYRPDFLLIHPSNIDHAGHKHGLDSPQYRNTTRQTDILLSEYSERWLQDGYQIMITSDHGMNNDKSHGGTLSDERQVPLFVIGESFSHSDCPVKQTDICGTVCQLLNLEHDKPYQYKLLAL